MSKVKAAFFDRDGTLIEDVSYLRSLDQIKILPKGVAIARLCQQLGYKLFVVTNQSGVARGFFDEDFVQETHKQLQTFLKAQAVDIHSFYYCPHHPSEAINKSYQCACSCRKPQAGMIFQAAHDYEIDLAQSLVFGDKESDLMAGALAGCRVFDITKLFLLPLMDVEKLIVSGTLR